MKKLLLFVFAALAFAACEQTPIEEQSSVLQDAPETLTVGFEDDDTRIQLNDVQKTVWTKGDIVSVFYKSNANQKWKYDGETGARTAQLKRVESGTSTAKTTRVVVVYPYNKEYDFNHETCNICTQLPATQHYLAGSYGENGNIMVSSDEYNQFSLKSVYGWLKLQIKGDGEKVRVITFRGNNGEQVAGEAYIYTEDASMSLAADMIIPGDDNNVGGSLIFDDTIITMLSLDCGAGVTLSNEPTAFYIALPPQIYSKGFTVEIKTTDGKKMIQSTDNEFTINRNHIQPMTPLTFVNNDDDGLYIPDEILKEYLVNNYDDDGDGEISIAESDNITMVNCSGKGVADLTGLEACTNLVTLNCANNSITTVELPNLTHLRTLTCNNNPIKHINLDNCVALEHFNLQGTPSSAISGSAITITNYTQSESLYLSIKSTPFTSLTVKDTPTLTSLEFYGEFTDVTVTDNTTLTSLVFHSPTVNATLSGNSALESVDVSALTDLKAIDVQKCNLQSLDVTNNEALISLNCSDNAFTTLDLTQNTLLETLIGDNLALTKINLSNNAKLSKYSFTGNPELTTIRVHNNFTMDSCLFTSAGNNPSLSIFNTAGNIFYYIGQYSTTFGSAGVVFEITNGGINGKMVSTVESSQERYTQWYSSFMDVNNKDDGMINMNLVKVLNPNLSDFPAFKWCTEYGTNWYLPAENELLTIYDIRLVLNTVLTANGHTTLGGYYWSSTYRSHPNFSFWDGTWYSLSGNRSATRAVLAF